MTEDLTPHTIQLSDVWVERASFSRRRRGADEELVPVLRANLGRAQIAPEPTAFAVTLRLSLAFPIDADTEFAARMSVLATFTADEPLKPDPVRAFVRHSGLYLIWPFARSHFASLARLAGVSAPPLPLLVRPEAISDGLQIAEL